MLMSWISCLPKLQDLLTQWSIQKKPWVIILHSIPQRVSSSIFLKGIQQLTRTPTQPNGTCRSQTVENVFIMNSYIRTFGYNNIYLYNIYIFIYNIFFIYNIYFYIIYIYTKILFWPQLLKKGSAVQPCWFQSLPAIVFHVDAVPKCGYVSHEVSKRWKLLHETVDRLFQDPPTLKGSTYVAQYQGTCCYPVTFPYALVLNHAFRTDMSPFGSASVP